MTEFTPFPKIPRVKRALQCTITEKIDGTNAQIVIKDGEIVRVGSRKRWITPGKATDNFGFAGWVEQNKEEILKLGDGQHFGEWYGSGIQRGYGLDHRRFALFNVLRWEQVYQATVEGHTDAFPSCCEVVPIIYSGSFTSDCIATSMHALNSVGTFISAARGFDKPEGIIVEMNGMLMKETFEFSEGKWAA